MVKMDELQSYMKKQAEEDRGKQYVNVSGETLEEALSQASIELSLPVKKIDYEILEKGSKGVFGVGKKAYLVLAYPAVESPDSSEFDEAADIDFGMFDSEQSEDQDGQVFVRLAPEGVMVKVTPPNGDGVRATEQMAMERIQERTSTEIDTGRVSKAVKRAEGEFIKVGEGRYDPSRDAVLSVEITDSDMKAYLTALPPGEGGCDPDYDTIVSFLQNHSVLFGFREDAIRRFEEEPRYREPILVAEGIRPQNGQDARIEMNFQTDSRQAPLKESGGRVDFKELNLIENVVEGQVLARKRPAEKGEGGRTVTGKLIPATDGKDCEIQVGKNVRLSEDGTVAYADINGQVTLINGKINVEPVYTVNGDVNLKTGNILFLGTVVVKGNVEDGFNVKAAGNIEVMGNVGKCQLDAEGDIIVHQGITGKGGGTVHSGKNLWSKFIENASVQTGGMVVVSDGIINSGVDAQHKVICRGKRASIVGGTIRASEEINAKTLGSVAGMETVLEVGYDPTSKVRLNELKQQNLEMEKELDEVKRNLQTLENQKRARKQLSEEKQQYMAELKKRQSELQENEHQAKEEIQELEQHLAQIGTEGRISASGRVYPGVKIHVKDATLDVRNEFKHVTFVQEANTVKASKYEEAEDDISIERNA